MDKKLYERDITICLNFRISNFFGLKLMKSNTTIHPVFIFGDN